MFTNCSNSSFTPSYVSLFTVPVNFVILSRTTLIIYCFLEMNLSQQFVHSLPLSCCINISNPSQHFPNNQARNNLSTPKVNQTPLLIFFPLIKQPCSIYLYLFAALMLKQQSHGPVRCLFPHVNLLMCSELKIQQEQLVAVVVVK